jgi:protocatechuate 4,5-dioxygenase, alpha chain
MTGARDDDPIDLSQRRWGHALNRMCESLADADNRRRFSEDEGSYCDAYGLSPEQKKAILERDWIMMMALGGAFFSLDGPQ